MMQEFPTYRKQQIHTLHTLVVCLAFLSLALRGTPACAQNPAQGPLPEGMELIDIEPFDFVKFTEKSGGGAARTAIFKFPGRKVPVGERGQLQMTLVGLEGQIYVAKWGDIEKIELWEDRLMREATERIAKSDFDGAYPFLLILMRDYPQVPGLRDMRLDFLYRNAADLFRKGEYKQTLTILETLREFDPVYKKAIVLRVIGDVTDKLMQSLLDEGQLEYAQGLLSRLESDYREDGLSSIKKWSANFLQMATDKRKEALAARSRKDMRSARKLSRESYAIWPRIRGGKELIKLIDTEFPLVNVGVLQVATEFDPTRIENWAARRTGRLLYRSLFEMLGAGPDGGEYDFIFGKAELSDDRKELYLDIEPGLLPPPLDNANAFSVAEVILNRANVDNPDYKSDWASVLNNVQLPTLTNVRIQLNRPHVIPQSMLQRKIDGGLFGGKPGTPTGAYRFDVQKDGVTRFVFTGDNLSKTQPREIVEIEVKDSADAVRGLLRGDFDVVDQLFPADAALLRRDKRVTVSDYPLPSVHMLIPCSDHAYLQDRTFRRALLYAIDRDSILNGELLGGKPFRGCQLLSGPFPAGIKLNDPLSYAYDPSIIPRTYQPRLGQLLITMAGQQMDAMAKKKKEEPPKLTPIRIAYPTSDVANVACEAIKTQLSLLKGFKVETLKLPPGKTWPEEKDKCDLVYVIASIWEPVMDARRVLGPDGLARSDSQLIGMGLRQLESSKNWKSVRDGLRELHRIANHELPVLPLWQLVDSYAFRSSVQEVGLSNVSLYQSVKNWQLAQ